MKKIKTNFVYIVAPCICLLFFLIFNTISFFVTYKKIIKTSSQSMVYTSKLYTNEISSTLHLAKNQLIKMSTDKTICQFIQQGDLSEITQDTLEKVSWQTNIVLNTMPILEQITYYTVYGLKIPLNKSTEKEDFMTNILSWMYLKTISSKNLVFVTLPEGTSNSPYFIISVRDNNDIVGYIIAKISKNYLSTFFKNYGSNEEENIIIFDKYHNILYGDITKEDWATMLLTQENFTQKMTPKKSEDVSYLNFKIPDGSIHQGVSTTDDEFNFSVLISVGSKHLMAKSFSSLSLAMIASFLMILVAAFITVILYKRLDGPLEIMAAQCLQIKGSGASAPFGHFPDKSLNILADTLNETIGSISAYQANLETMAFTDPLLGVGNRSACIRNMEMLIQSNQQDFSIFMITVVDFDHFNELFSVKTGDMILRKTAAMLDSISNSNVYRYNGDTFIIIISSADSAKCALITHEIKEYFYNPILLPVGKFHIAMDAGRADFPDHGSTAAELIRNSKIALKYAKTLSERNFCIVYNSIVDNAVGRHTRIKDMLINAINNPSEIELLYQPIYSLEEKKFTRLEALLRLKSTDMEISPKEVIAVAERNGLVNDLGDIIVNYACSFIHTLQDRFPDITVISINLSILQLLQHGFYERIKKQLTDSKIPLSYFEFEITESPFSTSFDSVKEKLEQFKALGIRLALDDFGSENSGINYLTNLPIDTLKISKQMIASAEKSQMQDALLKSIIDSCKTFRLNTIAEGIETEQIKMKALELGVDYMQGYYYASPMNKARLFSFLEETQLNSKKYL